MTTYLDASALLPMLVEEPGSAIVDSFMASSSDGLIVSDFAAAEVASALSRLVRMQALAREDATSRLADFDIWRATAAGNAGLQASDVRLADAFVRRFELKLRAPDALHLALCRRDDYCLVTMDRRLAAAAAAIGVRFRLLG